MIEHEGVLVVCICGSDLLGFERHRTFGNFIYCIIITCLSIASGYGLGIFYREAPRLRKKPRLGRLRAWPRTFSYLRN